ncbi:hypothetical protein BCR36DRAFT_361857 [Piromyces finnis]|uniref:SH3 domain-containing protein n=1 Tax=Piromyces finnis TaxID=1754191 RepID=A0A1Y1UYV3_9FUNG|nr:hypothetical protein BCR36DRAFT_361857 [Piromyces finnis]|eukprot:ORX42841.1 hypothetical protein BCR36DRAFT_361857 [Piromyces finnis]
MNSLIIISILFSLFNYCNSLLILPFPDVAPTIASGDKISIPISNDKFIISNCAALGNSYLYTEDNERTEYSPVAYFRNGETLELYIPEINGDASKKFFVVVELPLAEAIIKTGSFNVSGGSAINLPKTDGCGKEVKFSNKETNIGSDVKSNESNNSNENNKESTENKPNNKDNIVENDNQNSSNILSAANTSTTTNNNQEEQGSNHAVIIACAGTSVVALVVISGFVFLRGKSYMKGDSDVSYTSLNYNNTYSPKPFNAVGGLYDNLTKSNDDFDRDYQLRCLNDVPSQVSYPVSLSDGSCVNMDKNTDIFEQTDDAPEVPEIPQELPITKHIVEEIVINPEKVLSETINSNAVSAVVTTASVALAINECGDLTIDKSNFVCEDSKLEKSNSTSSSGSCSTCSGSCSCSSCSSCSCSCSGKGSCSCSCTESSRFTSTINNESSLKLLSLDFNSTNGDTTRGYSVFVDKENDSKRMTNYTETNYDDSRRMTNYTETNYDDSRRMTNYTETNYDDSRRMTNYTETNYDDSRRNTAYTDYTEDSRRNTAYTDYTEDSRRNTAYTDYTEDSRRNTAYTDYTEDSRRNTAYTDYTTEDSRRNTAYTDYTTEDSRRNTAYTDYTTEDSRRNTAYTDYTEGSSYTNRDSRYSEYTSRDSRYSEYTEGSSYTSCSCSESDCDCSHRKSEYTTDYSSYTDSRRQTYTTTDYSSYTSDFCETQDASSDFPSKILPNTSIEPFGYSITNESLIAIQSKQNVMRDSICSLLPEVPIEGKPPKIDLEFIAQKDYQTSKSGELNVKTKDVLRVIESLDGGCYMVANANTGKSGKIPAYIISTLL